MMSLVMCEDSKVDNRLLLRVPTNKNSKKCRYEKIVKVGI